VGVGGMVVWWQGGLENVCTKNRKRKTLT